MDLSYWFKLLAVKNVGLCYAIGLLYLGRSSLC